MKAHKRINYKKILAIVVGLVALIVFENALLMIRYERLNRNKPTEFGVSFSQIQAERYGSDWKANYIAILDDLKFKKITRVAKTWVKFFDASCREG